MARFTESEGVFFTEDHLDMKIIGPLEVKAKTQNTNLSEVKREAAAEAKRMGGNGVINYRYSQRADNPLKDAFWFKWDSERITISGQVVSFSVDPRDSNG